MPSVDHLHRSGRRYGDMLTEAKSHDLTDFQHRADGLVGAHPVVTGNAYTAWFATGVATLDDVRHLTVQFSVFSHQFLEAQLRRVFNARSLESYRAAKEILLNELGVVF